MDPGVPCHGMKANHTGTYDPSMNAFLKVVVIIWTSKKLVFTVEILYFGGVLDFDL